MNRFRLRSHWILGLLASLSLGVGMPGLLWSAPPPVLELEEGWIVGADARGRRVWQLVAASVTVEERTGVAAFLQPRGVFFAQDGRPVQFRAQRGEYGLRTGRVALAGSVEIVVARDRWLRADRAVYEGGQIQAERVQLRWERLQGRGDRLLADVGLRRARLVGNVRLEAVEEP
ncbi:MAG: hypothetical protein QN172_04330 [Armatimonadota bacterium]|nr:hypothetical protein [Armatimonadota bacterium]MDR7440077.1 hypothetical protein [Armatimonadota bacterium]MDR7563822.1 hypothetical protein [Armatimonadota bacterium]MDR7567597.1 hypothetical protein [Armatimonadota bacterium]MDR7601669.1 hypothetical protein [Armatimonadota bacterium]